MVLVALSVTAPKPGHYAEGPIPGHTGGFGEPTCLRCHGGAPLNVPGAQLDVVAPRRFHCGVVIPIAVRLERQGLSRGGFQLALRFASGPDSGRQAGRLTAGAGVEIVVGESDVQYAQHTRDGTFAPTRGEIQWSINWEAPTCPAAPVVLHVVANASNDDDSELGDHIYTAALRLRQEDD